MKPDASIARQSTIAAAVGLALAVGALSAAVLARVWVAAFPFAMAVVQGGLAAGLVGTALLVVVCALQAFAWWRRGDGLVRPSWWAHVLSYPILLVALVGLCLAGGNIAAGELGQYLCLGGALLAMFAQAVGATQYLRRTGAPGTIRAHLRRWTDRMNARADAEAEAAEAAEAARDADAAAADQRGENR